jgi:MFS superfamily sulfate permease-like transporter
MWLKHDLPAGLSVFLVALPLCLGIALASGTPVYSGLLSGIIGGLLVSFISGSSLAVSGPAAGLTTVVAASVIALGDYRLFLLSVVIAGGFQLLLGVFKLGAIANYFPSSVIKGMLAAIGIMLIAKQIPVALGYDQPDFWTSGFTGVKSIHDFVSNFKSLNARFSSGAIFITVVSFFVILIMQVPRFKKWRLFPASLAAVAVGIVANALWREPAEVVALPVNIFAGIMTPDFRNIFVNQEIWKYGLVIGLLASLETLLCIEAIDKLDRRNRITPPNRELIAQGIGNIACGLVGAIPITAVVVRGAANVDAGAKTKLAAFTHGLFLIIAVLFLGTLINKIPYASLSAILLFTGFNLTKPKLYKNMYKLGWKQFLPFLITIFSVLATDLLIGVSIGLIISIYFIVRNNFKAEYKISKTLHLGIDSYLIKLNSNVTFLNKVNLRKALDSIPEYSALTIDGNDCNFIDYDILEIISEFTAKANERHIQVFLKNIRTVDVTAIH